MEIYKYIKIDDYTRIPKYQQIVNSIIHNISIENFKIDLKIPSINTLSEDLYLSRDTVEKAYNILKDLNIIIAVSGEGYYIAKNKLRNKINILFLVNKLSWYKMEVYQSFRDTLGTNAFVDLKIYHCEESLFLNLLNKHNEAYNYYIIMPHFKTKALKHTSTTDAISKAINKIPKEKLVILDNKEVSIEGNAITVYEDYEKDIYNALKKGLKKISKYKKIILIYPNKSPYPYPKRIKKGFTKFCSENNLDFEILGEIYNDMVLLKGDLFITIDEDDLINLMNQVNEKEFILGENIGIISYNDTPLKALLGITVISTDFRKMGEVTSRMIINEEKGMYKVPFSFIDRESL